MATISNTPRPGYVWDATDNCWYPIGTGPHSHADYITSSSAINPNIVDAKGDIIAATAADTVSRLAVGSNDQVLTADSSTATGLKWATPAAGGMTLLSTTSLSGATVTISSISQSYNSLFLYVYGVTNATGDGSFRIAPNGTTNLTGGGAMNLTNTTVGEVYNDSYLYALGNINGWIRTNANNSFYLRIENYANTSGRKPFNGYGAFEGASQYVVANSFGQIKTTSAITSLVFSNSGGNLSTGTVLLYGVK